MNNKIKLITLLLVIFISFESCDDYLEILPDGQENSENYFNTPQDYEDALIGVYDLLATTYLNNILGEIASDNSLCGGENPTDTIEWQQIDDMIHNPDNVALRNIFQWMYAGISRANYIVENQNNIEFDKKSQLLAENLFLRSYYYFELVKFFGDVPLYVDGRITIEESQSINRTPAEEVYAQIESDLLVAINDLPWTQSQDGRATKGAALSLLGKIYLYQEKFSESADVLQEVIDSGFYQLLNEFNTIFLNSNENNNESVFEVQYFGGEGASFDCFQCIEGNVASGYMGPWFTGGDHSPYYNRGFAFNLPVQELVDIYDDGDTRLAATIFDIEEFVSTRPDVTYDERNEYTGYYNFKYIPYEEANQLDQTLTHSNNYRSIRYSDVLLMAAEALNRGTINDGLALQYLNQVRERAFGNSDNNLNLAGGALTEAIWHERRLELAGEGHRFFDQVRTGQTNTIQGFTAGKNELFPIPRIEIELAGNNWPQNPGY